MERPVLNSYLTCSATFESMQDPGTPTTDPNPSSLIQRAVESKDPSLASEALDEIATLLTTTTDKNERQYLLFSQTSCYVAIGDFGNARHALSLALQDNPDSPYARVTFDFLQGLILQSEERHEEAFHMLTSCLSRHRTLFTLPDNRFMYEDIQQRRAFLAVTMSKFEEAIPLLEESLSFGLDGKLKGDVLAALGLCHLEHKDFARARDHFLDAMTAGLEKYADSIHFYLGIAYYYSEMPREAKREFLECEEQALTNGVPLLDVYVWLSSICKLLGEAAESDRYARLATQN